MAITGRSDAEAEISATLSDAELEDIVGGASPHVVCCGSNCVT
ncbi:MAG TPA: hypothetical protein VKS82_11135 [Streptosporangiaceae bacterium]|nr:hypothetical protein [Streptosporangiaceae bacterium]